MDSDENSRGKHMRLSWILSKDDEIRMNMGLPGPFDGSQDVRNDYVPSYRSHNLAASSVAGPSLESRLADERQNLASLRRGGIQGGHESDENVRAANMGSYNIGPGPSSILDVKPAVINQGSLDNLLNLATVAALESRHSLTLPSPLRQAAENTYMDSTYDENASKDILAWKPKDVNLDGAPGQSYETLSDYIRSPRASGSASRNNALRAGAEASVTWPAPVAAKEIDVIEIEDEDDDDVDDDVEYLGSESSLNEQTSPRRSSPAMTRAAVFSQLRDHNHRNFRFPSNIEEWKMGPSIKPKIPAKPAVTKSNAVEEDMSLFREIHERYARKPAAGESFTDFLPPSEDLRWIAENVPKTPRRHRKRPATNSPLDGGSRRLHARESSRGKGKGKMVEEDYGELTSNRSGNALSEASPLFSSPIERRPPLDANRLVLQYTVFRTMRMEPPYQGDLMGKIIRVKAFADKNRANKHAASLMPPVGPDVSRLELDYGQQDPDRNGMFFGRVLYNDNSVIMIYVERETQQFGHMDPSEYNNRQMKENYQSLVIAPRYDVFLILNTDVVESGETYTVTDLKAYDKSPGRKAVREPTPSESSDDSDGSDSDCFFRAPTPGENDGSEGEESGKRPNEVAEKDEKEAEEPCGSDDDEGCSHGLFVSGIEGDGTEMKAQAIGMHYEVKLQASFMTLAQANAHALDVFQKWTRPANPPRINSVNYCREELDPAIEQQRLRLLGQSGDGSDSEQKVMHPITLTWKPSAKLRFSYKEITVSVVETKIEGPLDLTGAF